MHTYAYKQINAKKKNKNRESNRGLWGN